MKNEDLCFPSIENKISVLHCVPSLHSNQGGPARSVVGLTDALARCGNVAISLMTQELNGEPSIPSNQSDVLRLLPTTNLRKLFRLGLPFRRELRRIRGEQRPVLIHSHGIWHPVNHWSTQAARSWGVPLIIHPRGMLEPWSLDQKAWKKKIGMSVYQRRDLKTACGFVATSEMEYLNLRQIGIRQPIAVIPNGVDLLNSQIQFSIRQNRPYNRERTVLFLSRVHPKKGLVELVQAWNKIRPKGWRLLVAGPNENGHWNEVARVIAELKLSTVIEYIGPVEGQRKTALLAHADLFVLPTKSENFGIAVAEALAHGVPVITTRGAPWADLETYECGWWINLGEAPLVDALCTAMDLTDAERASMGMRGRAYVQRYNWDAIAGQTLALYQWVLGLNSKPSSVYLD